VKELSNLGGQVQHFVVWGDIANYVVVGRVKRSLPFYLFINFCLLVNKKVDINAAVCETIDSNSVCQNRYFIMHQRCPRAGKDRSFFQGLSFMLAPM
jgi:hypothetical protein